MIHEIFPKTYNVEYKENRPAPDDSVLLFDGENVCCRVADNEAVLPKFNEITAIQPMEFIYLFSIDEHRFFTPWPLDKHRDIGPHGYDWQEFTIFRTTGPRDLAFAVVTAKQLYQWYRERRYCGCCGNEAELSKTERAYECKTCGIVEYPKISPVVIVAVTHGENLLVTRYKNRPYRRYALVAGFSEIGESLEDTVKREVFEETGVRVKNLRYYKSQPWGFTSTLLAGFYCELDGSPDIVLDEDELSEAVWLKREDIPPSDLNIALTAEMMEMFRTGRVTTTPGVDDQ